MHRLTCSAFCAASAESLPKRTRKLLRTLLLTVARRYSGGGAAGGAEGGAGGAGDAEPEGVAACSPSAGRSRPVQIDSKSCFTCSGPAPLERTCWQNELHSRMALRNGTFAASSAPSSRCGLKSVTSPLPQQPPVMRRCAVRTVLARGRLGPRGGAFRPAAARTTTWTLLPRPR